MKNKNLEQIIDYLFELADIIYDGMRKEINNDKMDFTSIQNSKTGAIFIYCKEKITGEHILALLKNQTKNN